MARHSRLLLHHGGIGTLQQVMALGRPQLLVPRHPEQAGNTRMVARMRIAAGLHAGGRFQAHHVEGALRQVLNSPEIAINAAGVATRIADRGPLQALEQMTEAALTLLA